ncbi:metalloprotease family M14B [Thraustotheca clavata]|uniref:Metalloprotease family M14B n=1 Tax=Thraustotheca clavata TaxID=74557 RepID=A0A1V9ZEZ6_9STRA|nr:metalloprotease family M14B [Thraustotheca clavata]
MVSRVEVVSKTNVSLTVAVLPAAPKMQLAYSEYGYVYYSWKEVDLTTSPYTIKGLQPNKCYVCKARCFNEETNQWYEYGPVSQYMRTFTEEEETKRSGTYYEHALKLERQHRTEMQEQIERLKKMCVEQPSIDSSCSRLSDPSSPRNKKRVPTAQENMMASRMDMDANISKLRHELTEQASTVNALEKQRKLDEEVISELLNEQEKLRKMQQTVQSSDKDQAEIARLQELLKLNEEKLNNHQNQALNGQAQIDAYESSLEQKRKELALKEQEVERLMEDCRRVMQEHADVAHCKQLELEEALLEAKNALERQMDNNAMLHEEIARLREENTQLKQSIEEFDSKIAPKLVQLEEENDFKARQLSPEKSIPSPLPLYTLPAEAKVPKTGCPQRSRVLPAIRHVHTNPLESEPILKDDYEDDQNDDACEDTIQTTTIYMYYEPELKHTEVATTLCFNSVFESGNLLRGDRVRYQNHPTQEESYQEYELYVHPDINNSAYRQWFYFQVTNMIPGIEYRFSIVNLAKSGALFQIGLQPVVYSEIQAEANIGWVHGGYKLSYDISERQEGSNTLSFSYTFLHANDRVYFACIHPYTYTDLQDYLDCIDEDPERALVCRRTDLCQTLAGNSCDLLTITSPTKEGGLPPDGRRVIVISARVHPGESNSSFMMKGIIDYLTSSNVGAIVLRQHFIFKIVPMLNPDGVINGNTRVSLAGWDLNRKWSYPVEKLFPTIYHLKRLITTYQRPYPSGPPRVAIFCDLHGHSIQRNIFTYGCLKQTKRGGKMYPKLTPKNDPRIFPMIVAKQCNLFSFAHCNFKVQNSKMNTARVVVNQELGVINSYTLEASFCGADFGAKKDTQMSIADLESMGRSWCQSLLIYYELTYFVDKHLKTNAPDQQLQATNVIQQDGDKSSGMEERPIMWDPGLLNDCELMIDAMTKQNDENAPQDVDSDVSDAAQDPIPPNNQPELYRVKKTKSKKIRRKKKGKGKKNTKKKHRKNRVLLQGTNGGIVVPTQSIPLVGTLRNEEDDEEEIKNVMLDLTGIDTPTDVFSHLRKPLLSRPSTGSSIPSPTLSLENCISSLLLRPSTGGI